MRKKPCIVDSIDLKSSCLFLLLMLLRGFGIKDNKAHG